MAVDTSAPTLLAPLEVDPKPLGGTVNGRLFILAGPDRGQSLLVEDRVVLGRDVSSDIQLRAGDISKQHAMVVRLGPDQFALEDLGSRNGSMVNGTRTHQQHALAFGDRIQLGSLTLLLFARHDPAEDKARQIQKLESLGRVARGVAQDVHSVADDVLVNLRNLLEHPELPKEKVRESLSESLAALERVMELTQHMLGLAPRGRPEVTAVAVEKLAAQARRLLHQASQAQHIQVLVDVAAGLKVQGDATQLLQMLMNICFNAVDAMPAGGTLTMKASAPPHAPTGLPAGSCVLLELTDTGVGMAAEVMNHLFEPFFTTKPATQASGLGLATVYGIVHNHGGHVEIESAVGKGAQVRVWLPKPSPVTVDPPFESSGTVTLVPPSDTATDDLERQRRAEARRMKFSEYAAALTSGPVGAALSPAQTDGLRMALSDLNKVRAAEQEAELELRISALSRREAQTLEYLLAGMSEKEASAQLNLSQHTIHQYIKSLYRTLGVSSRAELLARCLRNPRR